MNLTYMDPLDIEKKGKDLAKSGDLIQWKNALRYFKIFDSFS